MKNKILLLILLLAGLLRLYKIDGYMEFLGDQGRDVVIVREFLTKGNLMFIGPQTSIGNMYLGPWYYYLISPFLLLANYNPVGPAAFVAILGVASIYLVYRVSRKIFNHQIAILSSFLMAISPVAIKYNNFSWNPNIMPFFSILLFYSLIKRKYILASLSFVMVLNSHYLGLLLLPLIVATAFYYKPKARELFLPLVIVFLGFLPLVLFDVKHNGQNISNVIKFFTIRQETVNLKPYKAIPSLIPLYNLITNHLVFGNSGIYGNILAVFSLLVFVLKIIKHRPRRIEHILLVIWLLSGLVGLALYKQHIYDHYFGFLQPAIFMMISVSVFYFRSVIVQMLLILVFTYLSLSKNPFLNNPNRQLDTVKNITTSIAKDSDNESFNLALLAKNNYDPPYRYFFYLANNKLIDIDKEKAKQLYVICELSPADCKPLGNPEYNIAAFGIAKIDKQWQINNITIFKLIND